MFFFFSSRSFRESCVRRLEIQEVNRGCLFVVNLTRSKDEICAGSEYGILRLDDFHEYISVRWIYISLILLRLVRDELMGLE